MARPQIVLDIIEVQKKVKIHKEHAIDFVKWMQEKGFHISIDGLVDMDRVIAGKRLAEYYKEYRAKMKRVEKPEPSSDWNRCVDADVKLDDKFLNKLLGMPIPEQFLQQYLAELGHDRYAELKSKILDLMSEHKSCTLRQLCQKLQENVVDILVILMILAQKGKIEVWQNEPFDEVFISNI